MSTLKADGIRAFTWHFFGGIGAQGIAFIVSIFLARLLEPAEFGLVAMVSVIIAIAQVFTNVGLAAALIQRRRVLPVHYSSVFYFNLSIGALLTLLVFLAAPLIADFYDQRQLEPLAQVMSLAFVINAFSTVQNTILFAGVDNFQLQGSSVVWWGCCWPSGAQGCGAWWRCRSRQGSATMPSSGSLRSGSPRCSSH